MGGPRGKYRERPKKRGAKRKQRVSAQKRRLSAAGLEEEHINRLTDAEVREEQKKIARKKKMKVKAG